MKIQYIKWIKTKKLSNPHRSKRLGHSPQERLIEVQVLGEDNFYSIEKFLILLI